MPKPWRESANRYVKMTPLKHACITVSAGYIQMATSQQQLI